ncbi:UNVERIFIED_CONTAM: FACT complex subunit SSRP1 [Sesamum indicum]
MSSLSFLYTYLKDVDDAVDPHLERIKNEAIGDDSDEEVMLLFCSAMRKTAVDLALLEIRFTWPHQSPVGILEDGMESTCSVLAI